jgi:hypothetical protein
LFLLKKICSCFMPAIPLHLPSYGLWYLAFLLIIQVQLKASVFCEHFSHLWLFVALIFIYHFQDLVKSIAFYFYTIFHIYMKIFKSIHLHYTAIGSRI